MKLLPLTKGKEAIVDDDDFDRLSAYKWHAHQDGAGLWYAVRTERRGKKYISMHRCLIAVPPGHHVDHVNGNGLDNRRVNLRACTINENMRNSAKQRRVTTSRYKGVTWHKDLAKWVARITCDGKLRNLGVFAYEADAARAYNEAARRLFGEFARLNEVDETRALCPACNQLAAVSHVEGLTVVRTSDLEELRGRLLDLDHYSHQYISAREAKQEQWYTQTESDMVEARKEAIEASRKVAEGAK